MAKKLTTMTLSFKDKRVVITGAGGGIGQALVAVFHCYGALVIACDRHSSLLDTLPSDVVAERHILNLADRASIQSVAAAIGDLDVLVNNAGFSLADNFCVVCDDAVDRELQVNLTGTIDFTRALLPRMEERGKGSVIFVSSVNAQLHVGNPVYSAAKAGQLAFSRSVAVEFGSRGIRSNAVCPGSVQTGAWDHRIANDPQVLDRLARHYPLGRIVAPEEVAHAVLFLASDMASGITGSTLNVDAGLTAGNLTLIRDIIGSGY